MGWFKKILLQKNDLEIVDIVDLDEEHYESFLDTVNKISIAYKIAKEKQDKLKS